MMKALVINLKRKPERMAAFLEHMHSHGLDSLFTFTQFTAVDGRELDLAPLQDRVSSSNWKQRERIRGILGCALSHLECWRITADGADPMVIFEDDARLSPGIDSTLVRNALENLPDDAGLIWLTSYNYWGSQSFERRLQRKLKAAFGMDSKSPKAVEFARTPNILKTMEAYVLTPAFAKTIYDGLRNDLGAIDRHLELFCARTGLSATQCHPGLFTQADPNDSSTRFDEGLEDPSAKLSMP